ncbi:MAG: hypothetical protein COB10_12535 [Planctomycetota bacterium]|nr:MAG: hypothetical protein COB10_12535 [Planctomycetota bacterium]
MKFRGLTAFSALLRAPAALVSVALVTLLLFPASAFAQGPCPATTGTTLNPVPLNQLRMVRIKIENIKM